MDEAGFDQAQRLADRVADSRVAHLRAGLAERNGSADCADCGEPIPDARRAAAPFASRCIHCQTIFERTPR